MRIALDYDGTFTRDPDLWRAFAALAKERGHAVSIVTMRFADDNEECVPDEGIPIVYTDRRAKASVFAADVWIDDQPQFILGSAAP